MNREDIKAQLRTSRADFNEAIDGLPEEAFLEPGVMGDWSLKDLMAHISRWEGESVTMLFQLRQGESPSRVEIEGMDHVDRLNDRWHREDKERELELVLSDFRGLREQTLRRVDEFNEDELEAPGYFEELRGRPLSEWIAVDTFEHEREHLEAVRRWRRSTGY